LANIFPSSGFEYELRRVTTVELEPAILAANKDDDVHGIIVYYPIFPHQSGRDAYIQQLPCEKKDVEGLSHPYLFRMYNNQRYVEADLDNTKKSILPCTPLALVKVLEYLHVYNPILPRGHRLFGRTITVINRSETVGRPLAALLANDGATVYSVDIDGVQVFTRGIGIKALAAEVEALPGHNLEWCLGVSDVVISGVPGPDFKVNMKAVKNGAVCVNFSSYKNFDKDAVKEKASIYVPAIGKVTIAVLLRNLVRLVKDNHYDSPETRAREVEIMKQLSSSFASVEIEEGGKDEKLDNVRVEEAGKEKFKNANVEDPPDDEK